MIWMNVQLTMWPHVHILEFGESYEGYIGYVVNWPKDKMTLKHEA